jgi:hypothetical protein
MMRAMSQSNLNGVVTMPGVGLRKQGDQVSQVVYFKAQSLAGFVQIPRVLTTVRGPVPYAVSVSDIDTTQFKLTLTAVVQPVADNIAPIAVEWFAYV